MQGYPPFARPVKESFVIVWRESKIISLRAPLLVANDETQDIDVQEYIGYAMVTHENG